MRFGAWREAAYERLLCFISAIVHRIVLGIHTVKPTWIISYPSDNRRRNGIFCQRLAIQDCSNEDKRANKSHISVLEKDSYLQELISVFRIVCLYHIPFRQ